MRSNTYPLNESHPDHMAAHAATKASHVTCPYPCPVVLASMLWSQDRRWVYVLCLCGAKRCLSAEGYRTWAHAKRGEPIP
jgi:hypothetical protein